MNPGREDLQEDSADQDLDLHALFHLFLRRRWIILAVTLLVSVSTGIYSYMARPVFEAQALLVIEKERSGGSMQGDGPLIEAGQDDYYQTQYKLMTSESALEQAFEALPEGVRKYLSDGGGPALASMIEIVPVRRSRLVYIKAASFDPAVALAVANAVAEIFLTRNLENQLFISKEVLQAIQGDKSGPSARLLYESLPAVVDNKLIQDLKKRHAELQTQAAEQDKRYKPKHPVMQALLSQMAVIEEQVRAETEKAVQSLKIQLSGQLKGNNVRIIDRAKKPSVPSRPRKLRNVLIGLGLGLMLGIVAAFLVDLLDQTVRHQEDIEQKLKSTFLGSIPFLPQTKSVNVFHPLTMPELSLTSESLRNLRTMVEFATVSIQRKQLLITSAVQAEGKSYVASNLAVAFSQLGEKVLVIDGDMRRPTLHKNFRLTKRRGLSDFLAKGQSADELDALVQGTEIPGLSALVCGTVPPNPSELLNTPRLGALIAWAGAHYDRLIVDCPPLLPIHDTLLWGRHIQPTIMVVRYGKTRVPLITNCLRRARSAGMNPLGVAINAATESGLAYAGYYGYYSYYREGYAQKAETSSAA